MELIQKLSKGHLKLDPQVILGGLTEDLQKLVLYVENLGLYQLSIEQVKTYMTSLFFLGNTLTINVPKVINKGIDMTLEDVARAAAVAKIDIGNPVNQFTIAIVNRALGLTCPIKFTNPVFDFTPPSWPKGEWFEQILTMGSRLSAIHCFLPAFDAYIISQKANYEKTIAPEKFAVTVHNAILAGKILYKEEIESLKSLDMFDRCVDAFIVKNSPNEAIKDQWKLFVDTLKKNMQTEPMLGYVASRINKLRDNPTAATIINIDEPTLKDAQSVLTKYTNIMGLLESMNILESYPAKMASCYIGKVTRGLIQTTETGADVIFENPENPVFILAPTLGQLSPSVVKLMGGLLLTHQTSEDKKIRKQGLSSMAAYPEAQVALRNGLIQLDGVIGPLKIVSQLVGMQNTTPGVDPTVYETANCMSVLQDELKRREALEIERLIDVKDTEKEKKRKEIEKQRSIASQRLFSDVYGKVSDSIESKFLLDCFNQCILDKVTDFEIESLEFKYRYMPDMNVPRNRTGWRDKDFTKDLRSIIRHGKINTDLSPELISVDRTLLQIIMKSNAKINQSYEEFGTFTEDVFLPSSIQLDLPNFDKVAIEANLFHLGGLRWFSSDAIIFREKMLPVMDVVWTYALKEEAKRAFETNGYAYDRLIANIINSTASIIRPTFYRATRERAWDYSSMVHLLDPFDMVQVIKEQFRFALAHISNAMPLYANELLKVCSNTATLKLEELLLKTGTLGGING